MDGLPRRQTTNLCASNHDPPGWTMTRNQTVCFWGLHRYLDGPFDGAPHGKRILCQRPQRQDRFAFRSRRPARAALRRAAFRPSPRSIRRTGSCPTRGSLSTPRRATLSPCKDQRGQIGPISPPPPARPSSCARRRPGRRKPKVPSRARRFCGSRGTQLFCFVVCITLICRIIFFKKPATFWNHALEIINRGLAVIPAKQDGYHSRSGGEFGPRINLS